MKVRVKPEVNLILQRLQEGKLDFLINSFEWSQFECKATPYQLESPDQRFEFAKDVSALANVDGGVIVIGAKTETMENGQSEIVAEIRPFPADLVDTTQMLDILREWLYPVLRDLRVDWYPSSAEKNKGVVAIYVPKAPEELRPIIVAKALKESGKIRGNVFGLFERWQDATIFYDAEQLHALIRSGQSSQGILQRLDVLQAAVNSALAPSTPARASITKSQLTYSSTADEASSKATVKVSAAPASGDIESAGLSSLPAYVLRGTPLGPVSLPGLFASQESPFRKLIQDPPTIRYGGFGVDGGGPAHIHLGQSWRSSHAAAHRLLELRRDGAVFFAAPADESFLCWGRRHPPDGKRVNPVVLIESVYLLAELLRQLQHLTDPKNVGYQMSITLDRARQEGRKLVLGPGRLDAYGWGGLQLQEAPKDRATFEESWARGEINPAEFAYNCVIHVYAWFGFTYDKIPFVRDESGKQMVDIEAIKTLQ